MSVRGPREEPRVNYLTPLMVNAEVLLQSRGLAFLKSIAAVVVAEAAAPVVGAVVVGATNGFLEGLHSVRRGIGCEQTCF